MGASSTVTNYVDLYDRISLFSLWWRQKNLLKTHNFFAVLYVLLASDVINGRRTGRICFLFTDVFITFSNLYLHLNWVHRFLICFSSWFENASCLRKPTESSSIFLSHKCFNNSVWKRKHLVVWLYKIYAWTDQGLKISIFNTRLCIIYYFSTILHRYSADRLTDESFETTAYFYCIIYHLVSMRFPQAKFQTFPSFRAISFLIRNKLNTFLCKFLRVLIFAYQIHLKIPFFNFLAHFQTTQNFRVNIRAFY